MSRCDYVLLNFDLCVPCVPRTAINVCSVSFSPPMLCVGWAPIWVAAVLLRVWMITDVCVSPIGCNPASWIHSPYYSRFSWGWKNPFPCSSVASEMGFLRRQGLFMNASDRALTTQRGINALRGQRAYCFRVSLCFPLGSDGHCSLHSNGSILWHELLRHKHI
jgi:hypothetical protein